MQHDLNPGYVLTDGYPFKSLETFLTEEKLLPPDLAAEMARGWCLNLPKGSYAPVQSRTRVQMMRKSREELKLFLVEWIYFRSCCNESTGPGRHYYPHIRTEADFSQVYPDTPSIPDLPGAVLNQGDFHSLEAFFVHYRPSFLQKSFLGYIEEAYDEFVEPLNQLKKTLLKALATQLTPENREEEYKELEAQFISNCERMTTQWKLKKKLLSVDDKEQMFMDCVLSLGLPKKWSALLKPYRR